MQLTNKGDTTKMKRDFLHSFSMSYQNAMGLISCYNNHEIGNPLGDNESLNTFFIDKIAPYKNKYNRMEFEIEDHDLNSTQPTRGATLNIFGVSSKYKNACCDEDWVCDDSEINGKCPKCYEPTINGKAASGCSWSTTICEECGASPCDGSC